MKHSMRALLTALAASAVVVSTAAADSVDEVVRKLNGTASVLGSKSVKSYPIIFEAFLEMTPPPMVVTEAFNNSTIHPGMDNWAEVSGWAESNPGMAKAILAAEGKTLFGLPYGTDELESSFREAGLSAAIGVGGSLRDNRFDYLDAIEIITAFATAEAYRLFEAGRLEEGGALANAMIFLLRQCCDREFLQEQLYAISLLIEMLENTRDMLYAYRDDIAAATYAEIAIQKLPFLRPDRSRLLLPEGDRVVSEALIREVFDDRGQADRERFASTFAAIQSKDDPLTRFGAARRWRMIAEVHDSEDASLERLELVYNDWWRRWRVEEYDPILDIDTQFEVTNPVRYAAVIYSMQDIGKAFDVRNELIAHVNGTAMAAGLAAYRKQFGTYPRSSDMIYAQFARKRSDQDPFDVEFLPFRYRIVDSRFAVDTPEGRVYVEPGSCILYSKGRDHVDGRGSQHTSDGAAGDIVMWPPVRTLQREAGLVD
jgi:hypothetical protein